MSGEIEKSVRLGRFTKKVNDINNKRYQASQASSYCGGLISGFNKNALA